MAMPPVAGSLTFLLSANRGLPIELQGLEDLILRL